MIVMKFGGASLASPGAIRRVVSIVRSNLVGDPVVVVSALGDTTDHLLDILTCASRADAYLGWKSLVQIETYHFCLAEDLLSGPELTEVEKYLRQVFRDLHLRMLELSEGERLLTPELQDWVLSLGEQLSSRIVTAIFLHHAIPAVHMDARDLILTDRQFMHAEPRYWETYARIRRSLPIASRQQVPVLGGFIGACEDGQTTTLGRGGSDLTASLVGAALNVEEVQVWKDVDGLLTWDPKLHNGKGYRVKQVSYDEMADLASAGVAILHPGTIAPVQRLRIPVIIKNTFQPECEGTAIGVPSPSTSGIVKSIACRVGITLFELKSSNQECLPQYDGYLEVLCRKRASAAMLLGHTQEVIYLALESNASAEALEFDLDQCTQAHLRSQQAIITLVGEGLQESNITDCVSAALASTQALILPPNASPRCVSIVVPEKTLAFCLEALRRILFAELDLDAFAQSNSSEPGGQEKEVAPAVNGAAKPDWRTRGSSVLLSDRITCV